MLLPGYFNPKELDKLDNKGRILNPHDYDVKTFSRLFYHGIYAAASIEELEMNGVEVKDFNKDILKTAIDKKLKEVGIYDYVAGVGEGVKK